MRSWRLATEAARLERADREEEGLMPAMALVTVERLSWRWLSSAPLVPLLFSKSDTSTGGEGEGRDGGKTQGQEEGREREKEDRDKKSCWEKKKKWQEERQKSKGKGRALAEQASSRARLPCLGPSPRLLLAAAPGSPSWPPGVLCGSTGCPNCPSQALRAAPGMSSPSCSTLSPFVPVSEMLFWPREVAARRRRDRGTRSRWQPSPWQRGRSLQQPGQVPGPISQRDARSCFHCLTQIGRDPSPGGHRF